MKRLLAGLAAASLAGLAAVVPATAATAVVSAPSVKAVWVNDTLRVTYPWVATGSGDQDMVVEIDGARRVGAPDPAPGRSAVYSTKRAASAGPAKVRVVGVNCIDEGEFSDCTETVLYSATVSRHAVAAKRGQVSALTLLGKLSVAPESHASSYKRSKFTLWVDANRNGENTRAEVLKAESKKKVVLSRSGTVRTGRWVSPYDGKVFTVGSKLDSDHLVPLEEAWTSGAASWSTKKRTAYANDLGYGPSLVAVSQHANRSKGDKAPDAYLPPRTSYDCTYVRDWVAVKYRWGLKVDADEKAALQHDLVQYCVDPYVAKPGKPNLTALAGSTKHSGSGGGGTTTGLDKRYPTCTELKKHPNHAPYHRGVDPEYAWYQDRDHDGWVCE
ncbi:excalibur calcium-binding domain-containing protein [Amnibacterium kyonggiense]|uniref:Excalibur calcium-binding domain-containing protein n=1 Tax=Amnibacterium kyonggiense TaxID=595671 RepID=A0A4R7FM85_9MICO|nr:DUF1524 domain-containing protein [Amnibacterium kyonggiense]TDS77572.1 excalibur calcium-binding domain-containing protein [Amnibacterium kyonggiense]